MRCGDYPFGTDDMQLKIDNLTFDIWDFRFADIERGSGLVVLLARHRDGRDQVLDARGARDMHETAMQYAATGRLRQHQPGASVTLLTCGAPREEARDLARALVRQRWVYPVEIYAQ